MEANENATNKLLFFEQNTREHQQGVARWIGVVISDLLDRMVNHDSSKFSDIEKKYYIDPVYELNTQGVDYGSSRYIELTGQMGLGWKHHKQHNDHHPEHFGDDPFYKMDLIQLLEMCCDWIAAAERKGNDPSLPIDRFTEHHGLSPQMAAILRNTLKNIKLLTQKE